MADEKGSSTITDMLQSRAGLAAIVLALASLLMVKPSPLDSERPGSTPGGSQSYGAPQDVDARLWQDPFQAVNDATKYSAADHLEAKAYEGKKLSVELVSSKRQNNHLPENIYPAPPSGTDANAEKIILMAVMMPASPTPEEHEARLRRRYALVSALASKEFAPVDAEHIGYFKTDHSVHQNLPEIIPFEWFEKTNESKPPEKVLVLWVDDTRFDINPMQKTRQLFDQITILPNGKADISKRFARVVMGPSSSGKLRALALEVKDWNKEAGQSVSDIWFYTSQATTADPEILKGISEGQKLSEYFSDKNIHFIRSIADDDMLINSLVRELNIRHVRSDYSGDDDDRINHVVLLSDWDTLYGRALPLSFEGHYEKEDIPKCGSLDTKEHVHCFKYVRGIDGILPGTHPENDAKSSQTRSESGSASKPIDRPDGMGQKDYLRRIVGEIRKLDQSLRKDKSCFRKCGVTSIGVLGYDVYDKLMILRALRPYFPNKIFFTTDLSASYWSPEEIPYTHNLIVSSGYGLTLNPQLQKDIPPFRDSYQTGLFLSVLLALEKDTTGKIPGVDKPRIFEIGRNGPIDFGNPEDPKESIPPKDCSLHISDCISIHPASIFDQSQEDGKALIKFILAACSLVLLYLASWNIRRWVNHIFLKSETDNNSADLTSLVKKFHWKRIGALLCFLLVVLLAWWGANKYAYNKEPWLWLEGVSIWPSELLRFMALVASILLIHDVFRRLSKKDFEIAMAFGFIEEGKKAQPVPCFTTTLFHALSSRDNCASVHKWKSTRKKPWLSNAIVNRLDSQVINVNQLWNSYLEKGEHKRRICRTLMNMVPFLIFAWSSIVLSGGMTSPVRGDFAYYADKLITLPVVLLTLFLTVLVIDTSRLCAALISHLDETQSDWLTGSRNSSCTMIHLSNQWGLRSAHAAYWLDAQFVAQRTEVIQKLIWYPVIPIFLLIAARSPLFDDWSHPAGLIATLIILIVYLISCAFLLEYGAKMMRKKANCKLGEELRKLRGLVDSGNKSEIEQLENLIKEIEGLKKGAFLPLFQQPWVEAILALASGAGGLAWMGNILDTP